MAENIVGMRFGRLLVKEKIKACEDTNNRTKYLCVCDCGNEILTERYKLTSSHTTSCGCYRSEMLTKRNKKYNTYDISGDYGIGYTLKGEEFYFDLEDYDKIKDYCWHKDKDGYIRTYINKKIIYMHRLVLGLDRSNKMVVDHCSHNTYDNRKQNLRICTASQNLYNTSKRKNNTSGVTGVHWDKLHNGWYSSINVDKKTIFLGIYQDFNSAVKARKDAEEKYFKNFSYDCSMKDGVLYG